MFVAIASKVPPNAKSDIVPKFLKKYNWFIFSALENNIGGSRIIINKGSKLFFIVISIELASNKRKARPNKMPIVVVMIVFCRMARDG